MPQQIKVWYDAEGAYLEVLFSDKAGYLKETNNVAVMERVDALGTSSASPCWVLAGLQRKNR
jgi:hypothetical protein